MPSSFTGPSVQSPTTEALADGMDLLLQEPSRTPANFSRLIFVPVAALYSFLLSERMMNGLVVWEEVCSRPMWVEVKNGREWNVGCL